MSELHAKMTDTLVPFPAGLNTDALDSSFGIPDTYKAASRTTSWIANNLRATIAMSMRFADALLIISAALAAYLIRDNNIEHLDVYFTEITINILLTEICFQHVGLYNISKVSGLSSQIYRLVLSYGGVASALIVLDYTLKISEQISRVWSAVWFLLALLFMATVRFAVWCLVRRLHSAGRFATPVAIIGSRASVRHLVARLAPELGKTIDLVSVFDVGEDNFQVFDDLAKASRVNCIDEVLIPLPWTSAVPLEAFLQPLRNLPVTVRLIPELPKTSFGCLSLGEQCGLPAISVLERPLTGLQAAVKRAEDLIISSIALTFAAPVMLVVALLIKLDGPGPVLFRQDRWGFNARKISVLKFRTMKVATTFDAKVTQATRNDPRVTSIGRILRKTSLDELPQLLNVLSGEMSLVGPRPHAVAHNEHYIALIDNYLGRHKVKPGITGLAQVNGCRGITDTIDKMESRVKFDLAYIDNWSLLLDLKVMLKTVFVGFANKNAF